MKPKYLAGVIIGAMLIYLALFGLPTGFSLPAQQLTTGFSDDFNDGVIDQSKWVSYVKSGYSSVNEQNGRLEFSQTDYSKGWCSAVKTVYQYDLGGGAEIVVDGTQIDGSGSLTLQISPDSWRSTPEEWSSPMPRKSTYILYWTLPKNEVAIVRWTNDVSVTLGATSVTPYGLKIGYSGNVVTFSYKLASGTWIDLASETYGLQSETCYIYISGHAMSGTGAGVQSVDNFNLQLSGAPPPPDRGSLSVKTYAGGNEISGVWLTITYSDGTQDTGNSPFYKEDCPIGYTTASGTYQNIPITGHCTIPAGGTGYIQLTFSGEPPPPPPNGGDGDGFFEYILNMINEVLSNDMVRSLMLMVGVGLVGVCGVLMFQGGRPPRRAPAPSYF